MASKKLTKSKSDPLPTVDPSDSNLNFNRINMGSDFKNSIVQQITDSTDSLPTWDFNPSQTHKASDGDDDDDASSINSEVSEHYEFAHERVLREQREQEDAARQQTKGGAASQTSFGGVEDTSLLATPMPKDYNPLSAQTSRRSLEKVKTAQDDAGSDITKRPSALRRLTTKLRKIGTNNTTTGGGSK